VFPPRCINPCDRALCLGVEGDKDHFRGSDRVWKASAGGLSLLRSWVWRITTAVNQPPRQLGPVKLVTKNVTSRVNKLSVH
jgi:hypothetical protein